jgi:uncharacterized repeat protein (TIGR02543 family)
MATGLSIPGIGNIFSETVVFTSVSDYNYIYRYSANGSSVDLHDFASGVGLTKTVGAGQEVGKWERSGGLRWSSLGVISSITYSKITTSSTGGGTVSGAGNYLMGDLVRITATPNSGYVVARIGDTVFTPSSGSKSISFNASGDRIVEVEFQKYYSIAFNANGGDGKIATISPCVAGQAYVLPSSGFTKDGYALVGFSTSATGDVEYATGGEYSLSTFTAGKKITLYAVWGQPTLTYDANGGTSTPDSVTYYGEITLANAVSRVDRNFVGWKIGDVVYSAGAKYTLLSNVTAIAQWSNISFKNTNKEAGKISLYDLTANKKVADENENGYLIYSGTIDSKYRVDCNLASEFYSKKGVYIDGEYLEPYVFTFTGEDMVGEYSYNEKPFYAINITSTPEGNSAAVTSPAEPDKDGKYVEGRVITVTGTPAPGYKLKAASIFDADKNLPIGDFDNIENNSFTIDGGITCNLRIACVFVKVDYDISVSVDEKSAAAISSVSAKIGDLNVLTATYGDTVTFEADVTNNYQFGGWYADNVLISADNPYNHTVNGNINLVAKAKVSVNLSIEHINNSEDIEPINSCSLIVDEIEVPIPYSLDVILGESFSYALLLGALTAETSETWKFDAWYSGEIALPYRKDDTITPTANLSMTARVTSAPIERTLSVSFVNEETSGSVNVTDNAIKISPAPKSKVVDGSTVTFVFEGTQEVQITFTDEIAATESLAFSKVVIGGVKITDSVFTYLLNGDIEAIAYYGSEGERTTSIDFATGSDRTMGEIVIDGNSSVTEAMPISVIKNRGEEVTITAQSKNGYKFVGWYINANGIGDPYIKLASTSLKVTTNRTLYAKFIQAPNAVYEWEGSNENKMMTWRSKTYESTKPFNPSACRVDTTGYPVWKMSVEMFSAPDATPTAVATLKNVRSQDSRRLPIRRMERYMQVAMENNNEVDAVFIGTSMGGLAI